MWKRLRNNKAVQPEGNTQSLLKAVKRRDSISAAKAMGKALIYAETHVMKALKPDRKGKTLDISRIIKILPT